MTLKAAEIRNKIEAEIKAGKSFADAATAAGVKAETSRLSRRGAAQSRRHGFRG